MSNEKDWNGNEKTVFIINGCSNHSKYERAVNDYYSTDPLAIDMLEKYGLLDKNVKYYEVACGDGSLSKRLESYGYDVISSDLVDRGYGTPNKDFLKDTEMKDGSIITNPPYKYLQDFILKGLELANNKLYIFAKIQSLEGIRRYENIYSKRSPEKVCVFVKRINCYRNGIQKDYSSAVCYCWLIFDNKNPTDDTKLMWLI